LRTQLRKTLDAARRRRPAQRRHRPRARAQGQPVPGGLVQRLCRQPRLRLRPDGASAGRRHRALHAAGHPRRDDAGAGLHRRDGHDPALPGLPFDFHPAQRLRPRHRQCRRRGPGRRRRRALHRQLPGRARRQRLAGRGGGEPARPARHARSASTRPTWPRQRAGAVPSPASASPTTRPSSARTSSPRPPASTPTATTRAVCTSPGCRRSASAAGAPTPWASSPARRRWPRIWSGSASRCRTSSSARYWRASSSWATPRRASPPRTCRSSSPRCWRAATTTTPSCWPATSPAASAWSPPPASRSVCAASILTATGSGNGGFDAFNRALAASPSARA
jgi:hypothetical protein